MIKNQLDIQELVTESGVPRRTVYFYVQQGILPPPQGAGLAAFYTEDHLLRLKLIPVMRSRGLRLDEIREQFKAMSADEMRKALDDAVQVQEATQPVKPPKAVPGIPLPLPGLPRQAPKDATWGEQRYLHYHLPGGITLSVPETLSPTDRQRLNLLLQAAKQIFSGAFPTFVTQNQPPAEDRPNGDGSSSTDDPSA